MGKVLRPLSIWLICTALLSGCWDRVELTEIAIVIGMGIDKSDREDEPLHLSFQVINAGEVSQGGTSGGGPGSPAAYYEVNARSISEGIRKVSKEVSRTLFFGHTRVLVLGKELARKGINGLMDHFERDYKMRTNFFVLVADGKATDVLKTMSSLEKTPAIFIDRSIVQSERDLGTDYGVKFIDLMQSITSEGMEVVAGGIHVEGDIKAGNSLTNIEQIAPASKFILDNIAVFKNEKLVGFLSPYESRGLAWVKDKVKSTVMNVHCGKDSYVGIEVIRSKTKLKAEVKNNQPKLLIEISQEANISEVMCDLDITKPAVIHELEKKNEEVIEKEINKMIAKVQKKYKTDVIGFGYQVHKADPDYWRKHKHSWREIYVDAPVEVKVKTRIRREGLRNKSYKSDIHKE